MFIDLLTPEQTRMLQALLIHLARVDELVDNNEAAVLERIAHETGVPLHEAPGYAPPWPELEGLFPQRREALVLILELLGLAYADGNYHPDEKALIQEIAERLQIHQVDLALLENWTTRQMDLYGEILEMLGGMSQEE
ncbi:TerB family tellurite resistance protein [Magnetofaba australis]|uniref:Co-chaperone DjlA N-terminal domain-containing protein n=1 Tax=Magnetofaba australis IT-1 TaxID=1434232 RepID=A0A1Y2K8P5_9PROT|nr:TerB family tellurite resistance protein [Magnetofaba australis]OSM05046.1 hypothetical protein MAIT1_03178 [Magnetofaba australis IT-1]